MQHVECGAEVALGMRGRQRSARCWRCQLCLGGRLSMDGALGSVRPPRRTLSRRHGQWLAPAATLVRYDAVTVARRRAILIDRARPLASTVVTQQRDTCCNV